MTPQVSDEDLTRYIRAWGEKHAGTPQRIARDLRAWRTAARELADQIDDVARRVDDHFACDDLNDIAQRLRLGGGK